MMTQHPSARSSLSTASTTSSRVWSHNTNYTGAAGIHSEDGSLAHARKNRLDRRSIVEMSTEEEILKKKMKSLSISRKSLEKSMLSYSKKMKDINERRDQGLSPLSPLKAKHDEASLANTSPKLTNAKETNSPTKGHRNAHSTASSDCSSSPTGSSVHSDRSPTRPKHPDRRDKPRNMSLPTITDSKNIITTKYSKAYQKSDNQLFEKVISPRLKTDNCDTVSVSSSVNTDTDGYFSDLERSTQSNSNQKYLSFHRKPFNGRRSQLQARKHNKRIENHDLESIPDTEPGDDEYDQTECEPLTISPFPENFLHRDSDSISTRLGSISEHDDSSDSLTRTRILDPITSRPLKPWKHGNHSSHSDQSKKKTSAVLTKPKATYSPSVMAMKIRKLRDMKAKRKPNKPSFHTFKYSYAVETALRSLNNSPEFRKDRKIINNTYSGNNDYNNTDNAASPPLSPDLYNLDLTELLNEVIQRPNDRDILLNEDIDDVERPVPQHRLYREQSNSSIKPPSFTSCLEQVKEDDDSELRSVLRRTNMQYPADKKSVQFFLPDIFLHANACTSRPAALR